MLNELYLALYIFCLYVAIYYLHAMKYIQTTGSVEAEAEAVAEAVAEAEAEAEEDTSPVADPSSIAT